MSNQDLGRAYDAWQLACEHGLEADFCDWIDGAVSQWRDPDRQWRLKNPIGAINREATNLARLANADFEQCLEVVVAKHGDDETAVRVNAMLEFARRLAARRRTA